ncbi:MAG: PAS domain-containing sensor histidine kinase, partial [Myxococcota bacterium]
SPAAVEQKRQDRCAWAYPRAELRGGMSSVREQRDEGLFRTLTNVFLTDELRADTENAFRARVIVLFAIAVSIWGPIYGAVLYVMEQSVPAVVTLLTATVLIGGSPLLMRRGVSYRVLGHWITFNTFLIVNAVAILGFGSESLWWQCIVVMVAVLLCSIPAGFVWMGVSTLSLSIYYLLVSKGVIARAPFEGITKVYWDFSVMTGLYVVVGLLTFAYESMKTWALDNIRRREAHTRAILGAAPDGIVTLDGQGRIDGMNRAAEDIFGFDFDAQLEHAPFATLVPALVERNPPPGSRESDDTGHRQKWSAAIGQLADWAGQRHETNGVRSDGTRFPLEISVRPIENDDRWVAVVRDITDRKDVERRLEAARDEAVQANESKSAFLANMSHELRTPLNAVIGYSELVGEELADRGHEEVLPDLERINVAGSHLLSLINDVLDISKIEAGRMDLHLEDIDFRSLLGDVVSTAEPLVENNGNRFKVDIEDAPERVEVDRTKLRQMLLNLLSNAAKFTEEAMVRLHVFGESDGEGEWYVAEVIDRGIGISNDRLEELFETFTQADSSTTREFGGTGLGLAITRQFAEMMGGAISVESTPGEGSTFRIKLPVRVSPHLEAVESTSPVRDAASA